MTSEVALDLPRDKHRIRVVWDEAVGLWFGTCACRQFAEYGPQDIGPGMWAAACATAHRVQIGSTDTDGGTVLALDAAELTAVRDALRYATLRRPDLRAGIPPVLLP